MKTVRLFTTVLGLAVLTAGPVAAQGFDPSFAAPNVYAPGAVYSALEQPDGKIVVNGAFIRVDGTTVASRLLRFTPVGALDNTFVQNVGAAPSMQRMHLLSNGQLLLTTFGSAATVGGVTRNDVLRLNADGTADTSFDAGTGPTWQGTDYYLNDAVALPSGRTVVVGMFDQFSGIAANSIARLTSTGAVDQTFNPGGTGANDEIVTVVALPSGKMLIGGYFTSYNGTACGGLARLNADGTLDPTFVTPSSPAQTTNITVQPDGKILISGGALTRLNADGSVDNTFIVQTPVYPYSYYGDAMRVQADGKILALTNNPTGMPLLRYNANGTLDASFQTASSQNTSLYSLELLANGKILVMGTSTEFSGVLDRPLLQLSATGAVDGSFQPNLQNSGVVYALARQADGKYVVGGNFSEINGQQARRLARFNSDGSLDAAFSTNAGGLNASVNDVALQPDGKVLVVTGQQVRRHLPSGSPDNTFATGTFGGNPSRLLLQPDGKVLVGGSLFSFNGQTVAGLVRLSPNGAYDNTFAPLTSGANSFAQSNSMALQPDGKILVQASVRSAVGGSVSRTLRLTSNGNVDLSFAALPLTNATGTNSGSYRANSMVLQPDGKVLLGGSFGAINGVPRTNVARLNADGTLDAGFTTPTLTGVVYALALQPNNRVLVGGSLSSPTLSSNLTRLNADGTADASYLATAVPNNSVRALLVQADGAIMAGGIFTSLSGQPAMGVVRISAPNVLHAALPQAVADRTQAWPVPARGTLNVSLDPAARAQSLELLDLLGRPVRRQALPTASETRVSVAGLPAGQYLLRVHYAQGTVARRISVQ